MSSLLPVSAVIPVFSTQPLRWLAGKTLLNRLLDKIFDLREVDDVQVIVLEQYCNETRAIVDAHPNRRQMAVLTVTFPTEPLVKLCRSAAEGNPPHIALGIDPCFPFLSMYTIEKLINLAQAGGTGITTIKGWNTAGGHSDEDKTFALRIMTLDAPLPIQAAVAVRCESSVSNPLLLQNAMASTLSPMEAIDASTEEGFQIADAVCVNLTPV